MQIGIVLVEQGIYAIRNKVTLDQYVGSSNYILRRALEHLRVLGLGTHINPKLQNAWDKYGEDAFEMIVLEKVDGDRDELLAREQHYMDMSNSVYNICRTAGRPTPPLGGHTGHHHTEETKERLRQVRLATPHTQKSLDSLAYGRQFAHTPEANAKRTASLQGRAPTYGHLGHPHSEETKARISQTKSESVVLRGIYRQVREALSKGSN